MDYIPPELREGIGEITMAQEHHLPDLIPYASFPGEFHVHSNYSDGSSSIEELVQQALKLNYKFIGICDHSQSAKYAHGLSEETIREKNKLIDELQKKYPQIKILKGIEIDILGDGSLDTKDKILAELDIVVAAIHTAFTHRPEERILKAMDNPYVKIIAHPTGKLYGSREAYEIDLERVFKKASERNIAFGNKWQQQSHGFK